jgi:hypothetical protein
MVGEVKFFRGAGGGERLGGDGAGCGDRGIAAFKPEEACGASLMRDGAASVAAEAD